MPQFVLPQHFTKRQIAIVVAIVVVLGALYFSVTGNLRRDTQPPEVKMTIWGPFDENQAWQPVFDNYRKVRGNVALTYVRKGTSIESYYNILLDALASGRGPDMFLIDNRALPREITKLVPFYPGYTYPTMLAPLPFGLLEFRNAFPRVAEDDFVWQENIMALPLYLDTLVLIYNQDALDQAGLAEPPRTWTDVQNYVPHLRTVNENRQIVRAAAALGGTEATVKSAVDIVSLLMLQNGAEMVDVARTRAMFGTDTGTGSRGVEALNFYLQFANAASPYYTWNDAQPYSLDAVVSGRAAMVFGYHDDITALRKKNPFAPIGVASMPQLEGATQAVHYAQYWGLAVSKQTTSTQGWAWDFITQAAANPARAKIYTDATKRPSALRSTIMQIQSDPEFGVFARQALPAQSWYQPDEFRVREIFNTVISRVLRGEADTAKALREAQDQVSQLMLANSK